MYVGLWAPGGGLERWLPCAGVEARLENGVAERSEAGLEPSGRTLVGEKGRSAGDEADRGGEGK